MKIYCQIPTEAISRSKKITKTIKRMGSKIDAVTQMYALELRLLLVQHLRSYIQRVPSRFVVVSRSKEKWSIVFALSHFFRIAIHRTRVFFLSSLLLQFLINCFVCNPAP